MSQDVVLHIERDTGRGNSVVERHHAPAVGTGAVLGAGVLIESEIPEGDAPGPVARRAYQQMLCVPHQVSGKRGRSNARTFCEPNVFGGKGSLYGRLRAGIAGVTVKRTAGEILRGCAGEHRLRISGVIPIVFVGEDFYVVGSGAAQGRPEIIGAE